MKHEVKVVRLGPIAKHENADTLGVTEIDGYSVVVRLSDWSEGNLGIYIEPDYVVPEAPWSDFLGKHRRIRVKKLRGVYSQGLLLNIRDVGLGDDFVEGDDVMERLGIVRYEPPEDGGGGHSKNPTGEKPHPSLEGLTKYDLESWQKYGRMVPHGTQVILTEKLHGENARFAWRDGRMWAGSRNRWVAPDDSTAAWWIVIRCNPWIEEWCKTNEDKILCGEVFGNVPNMRYGVEAGNRGFRVFDVILRDRKFMDNADLATEFDASKLAPVIYVGPIEGCNPKAMAEGQTTVPGANHVREGVVIKPAAEIWNPRIGRVALKCVGNGYLEKA